MGRSAILVYLGDDSEYLRSPRSGEVTMKRTPQLGLLYLSAVLKRTGVGCEVWDRSVQGFTLDSLSRAVADTPRVFVGFYSDTAMRATVCGWIRGLRERHPGLPILVGGPGWFSFPAFLEAGATMVCRGEGDATIVEMAEHCEGSRDAGSVRGVAFLRDGEVVTTPDREPIANLDDLPFPDRDAIDIGRYHDWRVMHMRTPYTTLITSRGCHMRCTFCAVPVVSGGRIRVRSPGNVLAEIDDLVGRHRVRYLGFKDDYFAHPRGWGESFCEQLAARRYDLLWSCQTHPFVFRHDRERKLRLFKEAGCDVLIFGLQSVDPDILRRIGRSPNEPDVVRENVAVAQSLGIQTVVELIFGLPGDTEETIREAVKYVLDVRPRYAAFYPLLRIEGSEIYDRFGEDRPVCDLSNDEVDRWCSWALRRYYLSGRILVPTLVEAMRGNPRWLVHGLRYLAGMLRRRMAGPGRRPQGSGADAGVPGDGSRRTNA